MAWLAVAAPYIAQGAGALWGYLSSRNKAKKAEAERQRALGGAQGVSDLLTSQGTQLSRYAMPGVNQSLSYYQTLLGGNRARMAQATAGPRAAITDTYRGAERNLEHSGIQGASRDLASAELNRDRASRIAALTTGVQPAAAAAVGDLSTNILAQGGQRLGAAGQLWSGLLSHGTDWASAANAQQAAAGSQLGSVIFDAAGAYARSRGAGGGGYAGMGTPGYPGDATSEVNNPIPPPSLAVSPSFWQGGLGSSARAPYARPFSYYDVLTGQPIS